MCTFIKLKHYTTKTTTLYRSRGKGANQHI